MNAISENCLPQDVAQESPAVVRMSLAAAMTLDFAPGHFYRNACLSCINLLLTYKSGCIAQCAYCGLAGQKEKNTQKNFIRVTWPTFPVEKVLEGLMQYERRVKRVCISMLTHKRAPHDAAEVCRRVRKAVDVPVSALVSPTIMDSKHLKMLKNAGVDKIGVAIDLATPQLFDTYRGSGVKGPHSWDRYWQCLQESIHIFGHNMAGAHLMVGMGETEEDMCKAMQRVRDMGGNTHLFSFFPEDGSALASRTPPPIDQYRRIQLARWLIDHDKAHARHFSYNARGTLVDYGVPATLLNETLKSGDPFRTCGCTGRDGEVACNRPYANARPGPGIRNYPFKPEEEDIRHIRLQMGLPILKNV